MLKINNELMPDPAGTPTSQPRVTITEWETPQNDLNIQKLSPLKFDWTFTFDRLERQEYEKLAQFFFAGAELLVEYQVGDDTLIDGYHYITVDSIPMPHNRLYTFAITVKPI